MWRVASTAFKKGNFFFERLQKPYNFERNYDDCKKKNVVTLQNVYRTVKDGTTWYLAKWRDLPYDQATWETGETDDTNVIADFDKMMDEYHALRYNML